MRAFFRRFSLITGFSLIIVLLIGNAIVTRRKLGTQIESQTWFHRSEQVQYALVQIQLLLVDAETGQRGYFYTGDPKYLNPYNAAINDIDANLKNLAELTSDNPPQQANVVVLHELVDLKLQELAETIALYRSGKTDDAKSVVLSDRGLMIMNDLRHEIDRMQREELVLANARDAAYQQSIHDTVLSIYLATVVAAIGLIFLARYISRERRMREVYAHELAAREQWFRTTLSSIGDAVIATDAEGYVTFLNPIAEQLTGFTLPETHRKKIEEIFPIYNEFTGEPVENPVAKVMSLGVTVGLANHTVLSRADGRSIPIEDSAAPIRDERNQTIGVVLVFRDVTANRKAQDLLRKTEKLAAAARLSATVAHEINNPLEAVINLLYIAKASPGSPQEVKDLLEQAEQELDRVAHITRQTLGFYRDPNLPENIQIGSIVSDVLKLYANKVRARRISVDSSLNDCPVIWGVRGEMKQVVSNLMSNAIDAVAEGGRIAISCSRIKTGDCESAELVVEDNGPGVSAQHIDQIFDPFFTTKKDVGTGLGLWVTREIVERHGGTIELLPHGNREGFGGAAFVLRFPCSTEARIEPLATAD
ncbi:MAG TPA: CHASE3 domain-containing protein [Terracidiphilus sp.]|nr:CHASE3 domain-containing protein [Terracidiphilus sp.]